MSAKTTIVCCAVLLALVGMVNQAGATLISLTDLADTKIDGGTGNLGTADYLSCAGTAQQPLIKWDVTGIPAGQAISNATMTLTARYNQTAVARAIEVYRSTKPWTELGATGVKYDGTNNWATINGDYVGTTGVQGTNPYATLLNVGNTTAGQTFSWDVTNLVSQWYAGTYLNYGMELKATNGDWTMFASREASTTSWRPTLVVTYAPVPEPSTLILLGCGLAGLLAYAWRKRK